METVQLPEQIGIPLINVLGVTAVGKTTIVRQTENLDRSVQVLQDQLSLYEARAHMLETSYVDSSRLSALGLRATNVALSMEPAQWHHQFNDHLPRLAHGDVTREFRRDAIFAALSEIELLLGSQDMLWVENEYGDARIAAAQILRVADGRGADSKRPRQLAERLRTTIQTLG